MAWSDILGGIGTLAGVVGGAVGGGTGSLFGISDATIGKGLQLAGGALSAASSTAGTMQSADMTRSAAQAQESGLNLASSLAQQRAAEESQAYKQATSLIPKEQAAYTKEMAALGPYPSAPQFDQNTVITRANQLMPEYMLDADRASTEAFSKDLGGLMRAGIDTSTYGLAARATQAGKATDLHQAAYNKAYDDALSYAQGIYGNTLKGYDATVAARAAALKEATDMYGTGITDWTNIYAHTPTDQALSQLNSLATDLAKTAATPTTAAAGGADTQKWSDLLKQFLGKNDATTNTNNNASTFNYPGGVVADVNAGAYGGAPTY